MTTPTQRGKRVKRMRNAPPPPPPPPPPLPPPPLPPSPPPSTSSPEELADINFETDFNFNAKKMTRLKSCGKRLHDILEANNGKNMPVIFYFKLQVPSDLVVSGFFTTEIRNIVWAHSPVSLTFIYLCLIIGIICGRCGTPTRGRANLPNDRIWNGRPKSHWD
ncbi:hypothetical protein D8674_018946 [Pyrus ussuriensis x Pyrus communis]|uniref:Uncharacterized protein n=1 Tax=Pyrus ussuriensis x Pyrus communis TaxID=2448454 RepID=A0A5N5GJH3_9ROSA|nr:hypothetical protein D8674_018946 [Pyrus ussuriensis x Pyrus communis]